MWNKQKVGELMKASGLQKLDSKEVKARELAEEWMRVYEQLQEAIYGIEEEACYEEAQDIKKEATQKGLVERVNQILAERNFKGELIEQSK
ncbi:MAG: hypothetical protein ICV63_19855 [Coleofasciculus sp. Co-bin14]|nr:hypothetical protein [Coleofasciculus sp. Co-bin14]